MIPEIFHIGIFPINSFGLMIASAILAAGIMLGKSFHKVGINFMLGENYSLYAGVAGLIGARIWYLITNYTQTIEDPLNSLFSGGGFTFYGGFIFAWLVTVYLAKRDKLEVRKVVNAVGPALCLGYAIGRLGCQLSGDGDYGSTTDSILGMSFKTGLVPTMNGVNVFPTPIYESIMALLIMFILIKIEDMKILEEGYQRFGVYLSLISIERFLIEFIRVEPRVYLNFTEAQILAVILFTIGIYNIIKLKLKN